MPKIQARTLRGFRDYLPADMLPRAAMLRRVADVFETFGFAPLETPALEYSEVLLGKYGDEGDKLLYRFRDNGDRDVALRYDLTVPLARVVAMHGGGLTLPFKRYQIAPVWRAEKPGRGRFREFSQCDADIIGAAGAAAEVEILAVGCAILEALGVDDFRIRVNHRGVFDGLLDLLGVTDQDRRATVVRTLDKLDKIGREKVRGLLASEAALGAEAIARVEGFLDLDPRDLSAAAAFFDGQPAALAALTGLGETLDLARDAGLERAIETDLTIARGLDYYTGLIYETALGALPEIGSVMSGGRYDGLMDMFGAPAHPAIGISLGVDRLFAALSELDRVERRETPADALVAVFGDDGFAAAHRLAAELRAGGVNAEVFLGPPGRMKKQFRYADRKGIARVLVCGPDEAARGVVVIKDLRDGSQREVPRPELAAAVSG